MYMDTLGESWDEYNQTEASFKAPLEQRQVEKVNSGDSLIL